MVAEDEAGPGGVGRELPIEPAKLIRIEPAAHLPRHVRVEAEHTPLSGVEREGERPGGGSAVGEDAAEVFAVVVVARHEPGPVHPGTENLAQLLVGGKRLVLSEVAGQHEVVEGLVRIDESEDLGEAPVRRDVGEPLGGIGENVQVGELENRQGIGHRRIRLALGYVCVQACSLGRLQACALSPAGASSAAPSGRE